MFNTENENEKLSKFFKILCNNQTSVELHQNKNFWKGVFKSISKTSVWIQLAEDADEEEVPEPNKIDSLRVQFAFKKERYLFSSRLLKKLPDNNLIDLELPDSVECIETRRFKRINLDFPIKIYFPLKDKISFGLVVNISEKGLLFKANHQFSNKKVYPFAIPSPADNNKNLLLFMGRIIHSDEGQNKYITGIRFNSFSEDVSQTVKEYVAALKAWDKMKAKSPLRVKNIVCQDPENLKKHSESLLRKFSDYIVPWKQSNEKSKKRILCVVADMDGYNNLKLMLSDDYELNFIIDEPNIISKMTKFNPHLVLSDIDFKNYDFFMMRKYVMKQKELNNIPCAIYTYNSTEKAIIKASQEGNICEYIVRPITKEKLVTRLERILNPK